MTLARERIGIKWYEGTRRWQIFGLLPDHHFYGEYIDEGNGEGFKGLEGTVPPVDYQRIVSLVETIRGLPPHTRVDPEKCDLSGVLFEGFRSDPHVLFTRSGSMPAPVHEELFAEIVEVMRKYCDPVTES